MQAKGLKGKGDPSFPYQIPVDRVARVIENYVEKNVEKKVHATEGDLRGLDAVSNLTGFLPRRIYSILKREYQSVKFDTVDKLFIGLQCQELWHIPPEEGGFADLYECETVQPPLPPLTEEQEKTREKLNAKRRESTARGRGEAVAA